MPRQSHASYLENAAAQREFARLPVILDTPTTLDREAEYDREN